MGNYYFLREVAIRSDEELIEWAAQYGLTPRPDESGGETISNFRQRVIDCLGMDDG